MTWLSPTPLNVGVAVGRNSVSVIGADGAGALVGQTLIPLSGTCFMGDVSVEMKNELDDVFRRIAAKYGGGHPCLRIALPDAAVIWRVFPLEHKPQKSRDTATLARWLLAKETGAPIDALRCAWQWLDATEASPRLLVIAFNRPWVEAIEQAAWRAGLLPRTVAADAVYVWNDLHCRLPALRDVAILRIDTQQWTVMLIVNGNVEYVHGRWRREDVDANDIAAIIAQSVKAFVCAEAGHRIDEIVVVGHENDAHPVMNALQKLLHVAPRWIAPTQNLVRNDSAQRPDIAAYAAVEAR